MKDVRIVGVDLGKNSCSVVGLDASGRSCYAAGRGAKALSRSPRSFRAAWWPWKHAVEPIISGASWFCRATRCG